MKAIRNIFALLSVAIASLTTTHAQTPPPAAPTGAGFSFAVYGDSRSMMYLPPKSDQRAEAIKLLVTMFELVMPEKIAEEAVQKNVKLIYDPATKELVQVVMPFMSRSEVMTLTVDQGWITEASVEDMKLLPGVRRTMFRLHGGEWVAHGIVNAIQSGRARFTLNTGDMVWWGTQGPKPSENPYWKLVYEDVLKQMPAADTQMQAAGLPGRVYPAVGNHEVWDDSDVEGLLTAFPYLKKFGVTDKRLIYKFDFNDVRFIFLWTGPYDYRQPSFCVAVARNRIPSFPAARASKCPKATRRTSTGKASRPRRNTTICWWMCNQESRRSLRSIVSGRGRLNRSRPSICLALPNKGP